MAIGACRIAFQASRRLSSPLAMSAARSSAPPTRTPLTNTIQGFAGLAYKRVGGHADHHDSVLIHRLLNLGQCFMMGLGDAVADVRVDAGFGKDGSGHGDFLSWSPQYRASRSPDCER